MFSSSAIPGVLEGSSISGATSGQMNKWYFPCLSSPLSSKRWITVDPRGLIGLYFLAETYFLQEVPNRDGDFRVSREILVEIVEDDRLIEQIFGDKEARRLRHAQRSSIGIELKGEVYLIQWVGDDLILDDSIFVNDSFEVDPHLDFFEVAELQALHW